MVLFVCGVGGKGKQGLICDDNGVNVLFKNEQLDHYPTFLHLKELQIISNISTYHSDTRIV